jgi:hypothetical protein
MVMKLRVVVQYEIETPDVDTLIKDAKHYLVKSTFEDEQIVEDMGIDTQDHAVSIIFEAAVGMGDFDGSSEKCGQTIATFLSRRTY